MLPAPYHIPRVAEKPRPCSCDQRMQNQGKGPLFGNFAPEKNPPLQGETGYPSHPSNVTDFTTMQALKAMRGSVGLIALFAMVACLHMQHAVAAPTGAVLGIDLGSDNCVVAIARRKGVDIVTNEASARSTPTIVSVSNPCCPKSSFHSLSHCLALAPKPHRGNAAPRTAAGWMTSCCATIIPYTCTRQLGALRAPPPTPSLSLSRPSPSD